MNDQQKQIAYIQAQRRIAGQAMANGGLYIQDCQPWAIKANCTREDCPMRGLAIYEAQETDYFTDCTPLGVCADVLLTLQATQED